MIATYKDFMAAIVTIYGNYDNIFVENIVSKYIQSQYKESDLEDLLEKTIGVHSSKFKTKDRGCPPDVCIFEEIRAVGSAQKGQEAWDLIYNVSAMSTVFFESLILHAVIVYGFSTWPAFADQRDHSETSVWTKKTFLDLFNKYSRQLPQNLKHCIMPGIMTSGRSNIQFIGDKKKCQKLLNEIEHMKPQPQLVTPKLKRIK